MSSVKEPRIVAELGRPETAQETIDRRAASSRAHRQNQNFFNLVVALLASLAVVALVMLVVVRPDAAKREPVDFHSIALDANAPVALAAPALPEHWWANSAIFNGQPADGVANWYVGFITPSEQFIALRQGIDANPTWLANELAGMKKTGSTTIDGIAWSVHDRRGTKDAGNYEYAMSTVGARSTFILFGTASDNEFEILAKKLAPIVTADR